MTRSRELARSPWFIFAVALAARLLMMLALYRSPELPLGAFWDTGLELGRVSSHLAASGEFRSPFLYDSGPSAVMTPVYPLLIAGIFRLFGAFTPAAAWTVMFLQALFSSLVCVAVFHIGNASFGRSAGVWSAWIWAVCPHAQFMPLFRFWENCLAALLAAGVFLLLLRLARETRISQWLGFGVLAGVAVLNNPSLLGFILLAGAWVCCRRRKALRSLRPAIVAAAALVLVVTPWTVRNYRLFHEIIPIRDNFGLELWVGNHQGTTGRQDISRHPVFDPVEGAKFRDEGEIAYIAEKQREAIAFIRAHPGTFLRLTAMRVGYFWTGWDAFGLSLTTLPIFALGFWQLLLMLRRRHPDAILYATLVLVYPLTFYITHPDVRFRHTIEPVLFVLAGACLAIATPRFRSALSGTDARPREQNKGAAVAAP